MMEESAKLVSLGMPTQLALEVARQIVDGASAPNLVRLGVPTQLAIELAKQIDGGADVENLATLGMPTQLAVEVARQIGGGERPDVYDSLVSVSLNSTITAVNQVNVHRLLAANMLQKPVGGSTKIRIVIKGNAAAAAVAIAATTGDAYDAASSYVPITFGGAASVTGKAATDLTLSDEIDFVWNGTSDLLVALFTGSAGAFSYNNAAGTGRQLYYKSAVTLPELTVVDKTGYVAGGNAMWGLQSVQTNGFQSLFATATSADTNVVVTGNSIPAGATASGPTMYFPAQMSRSYPLAGTGIVAANKAQGAQSWTTLEADWITPVHNAWAAGKRNVLVAWESSNQIALGSTVAECTTAMLSFFNALLAVHPWDDIVLMTCIPRGNGNQTNTTALNNLLAEWNEVARAQYKTWEAQLGVPIYLCDIGATPPFDFFPPLVADFDPGFGIYSDTVHLGDNGQGIAARIAGLTLATVPA